MNVFLPFESVTSLSPFYSFDKIDNFIEAGQYGTVYSGVLLQSRGGFSAGTNVAIKEISKSLCKTHREVNSVINEVEILKQLRHRNTVYFVEALQTPFSVYLVMELVDCAQDLFTVLKGMPQIDRHEQWVKEVTWQLVSGVAYLHDTLGICHRDIKCENILCSTSEERGLRVAIVDYGHAKYIGRVTPKGSGDPQSLSCVSQLARPEIVLGGSGLRKSFSTAGVVRGRGSSLKTLKTNKSGPLTSSGAAELGSSDSLDSPMYATPCGTMLFAAPETVRSLVEGVLQRFTTRKSLFKGDMFSVGIILHVMLVGHVPYNGGTKAELLRQEEAGPGELNEPAWQHISKDAKALVASLLDPQPLRRLSAAETLAHPWFKDLRSVADPVSPLSHTSTIGSIHSLSASFSASLNQPTVSLASRSGMSPETTSSMFPVVLCEKSDINRALEANREEEESMEQDPVPMGRVPSLTKLNHNGSMGDAELSGHRVFMSSCAACEKYFTFLQDDDSGGRKCGREGRCEASH